MPEPASPSNSHPYLLGHSEHEIGRLEREARIIDPVTRDFFREAGVVPGMRVLDVGCGGGDVSFLVADLVGRAGEVIGVDRSQGAVDGASRRAKAMSLANVSFVVGDPAEMAFDRGFDAVLGRYVLQFQSDAAAALRKFAAHARPGGVVVFHELDWSPVGAIPTAPIYDQCCRWAVETLQRHRTEFRMGRKLYSTFVAAGLPLPELRIQPFFGCGPTAHRVVEWIADFMVTLMPEIVRLGVASASEVGIETLAERLLQEAAASSSLFVAWDQMGAWSRR